MKIAFIVGEFPTLSETFVLNQITGLIDLGHDVEIFAQKGNISDKMHSDVINYGLINRTHYYNIPQQKIKRILKAISIIITNFYRSPLRVLRSLNIFKYGKHALSLNLLFAMIFFLDKDFDIIYCHFGSIGNFGACLKQIGIKGKLVTMFHGADIRIGILKGESYYKKLFEVGDCFFAISGYSYKKLVRLGADPKKIIFHSVGIDIEKFNNRPHISRKQNTPVILTVARLVEEKGLSYGLESIRLLLINKPRLNIKYKIIGDGPLKTQLEVFVKLFKLNSVVEFLGAADQKGVIEEMNKSVIFLLPSIEEALPVVLMEAQSMRLPVITTDVGGIPETIVDGKSGFIVPAKDINAMANKIEYLINNQKVRLKMGEYGRKFVEKRYSIVNLNNQLCNIFNKLLKEKDEGNEQSKKVIITTSWDDGHLLDIKLAKLLTKYKIPATFYIPLSSSRQKIISDTKIRELNKSFEIGCHTSNHINLTQVSNHQAVNEILNGKKGLEKTLHHTVSMFSYPFGSYDNKIVSILKNVGIVGARTTKIFSTKPVNKRFEINTTIHASNHPFSFYLQQVFPNNVLLFLNLLIKGALYNWEAMSSESLKYVVKNGGVWHLWGHSWEIEKNNDWNKLERVFKKIIQIKHENPEIILSTNSGLIKRM